ncbi:MAG: type II toxin-antitoxin system VapC family toxin [Mesorhizobium sp.]|nr:type II toxin-antitoxin system VapC family toxin [Mesorhizobium sp.]MBL8575906.1 type II toxin-antitoxin system VapC family toxin [Mesorhizobium sp.]
MPSAVDTNVLLRVLVDDGSEHVAAARRVFAKERVFVPLSVMLESEWVLRSNFGFNRSQICDSFDRLLGLDSVTIQDIEIVGNAVSSMRDGMDFADALHLHSSANCDVFYTFDKKLVRNARDLEPSLAVRSP